MGVIAPRRDKISRWWGIIVGTGLALSPIHNQWLTRLATNSKGEVVFFLPAFGYLLLIMGMGLFLLHHWDEAKKAGWGDKRTAIPLLFIVGAIALSGATADGWQDKVAPLGMGTSLFGLYLMARIVGRDLFVPLAVGAGIASLGVIISGVLQPGLLTGGLVFEWNYDIVVGYILLGAALLYKRGRLPLIAIALVAMFLSGSPEAVFAVFVVGIVVLLRKDWSKELVWVLAPVVVVATLWFSIGYGQQLYSYAYDIVRGEPSISPTAGNTPLIIIDGEPSIPTLDPPVYNALEYRLIVIKDALTNLKPLGEGYNLTNFSKTPNVHNVPLVIVQQLGWPGIVAGVLWLWVSIWYLVKTKWKYAWALILALSVFDHYIWTQLAPVWWVAVGVSLTDNISSDLLFQPIDK